MADQQNENSGAGNNQNGVDLSKILLPKKETPGQTTDSATRVSAGELVAQEEHAAKVGLPPPAPVAVQAPVPPPPKPEVDIVRPLQTYQSDIESLIQEGGVSEVSIAAAEAVRKDKASKDKAAEPVAPPPPAEPGWWHKWVYVGIGSLLLLAAAGLIAFIVLRPTTTPVTTGAHTAIIYVDDASLVQMQTPRSLFMNTLEVARTGVVLSLGLIERLYITDNPTAPEPAPYPIQDLLTTIAPEVPIELLRTLEPEYLLGVHSFDRNQPFLILRTDSYDVAYRAMLEWERTLAADLSPVFKREVSPTLVIDPPPAPAIVVGTTTTTSTASSTPVVPIGPVVVVPTDFVDRVVLNRDTRVLENADGEILLLWTFLDRRTIVITTNDTTLREVILRMAEAPIQYQP